jgi:DNA topoisomerase VI subunit B
MLKVMENVMSSVMEVSGILPQKIALQMHRKVFQNRHTVYSTIFGDPERGIKESGIISNFQQSGKGHKRKGTKTERGQNGKGLKRKVA